MNAWTVLVLTTTGLLAAPVTGAGFAPPDTVKRDTMETVLGNELTSGGYGGPIVQFGEVGGRFAVFVGGEGAWVINHRFLLGGRGVGLATENAQMASVGGVAMPVGMGYGGVLVGYIVRPNKVVHGTFTMLFGGGGVGLKTARGDMPHADAIAVFEPSAEVEVNLARWFRFGIGGGYRFVTDTEVLGMADADFDGGVARLVVRFGSF